MPFTFIGVYVCLTDFILQNKETRNHPSRPPPPKKKKEKNHAKPRAWCRGQRGPGGPALVCVSGCRNTGVRMAERMFTRPICCAWGPLGPR